MKLQKLVIDRVIETIEESGLTATNETSWANTGHLLALDGDLDTVTTIAYDFQSNYFSLRVFKGPRLPGDDPVQWMTTAGGKQTTGTVLALIDDYLLP